MASDEGMEDSPLTRGEVNAARVLNLLFALDTSRVPLKTEQILSDSDIGYGSRNRDSDLKKFRRDRALLERQGIYIREVHPDGAAENESSAWEIDRARTEVGDGALDAGDAEQLLAALDRYLAGSAIPYRETLGRVRAKVAEAAGDGNPAAFAAPAPDPILEAIWAARALKRSLTFAYRDGKGVESRRTVDVYGIFSLQGSCYFVGLDRELGAIRTFRADRVLRANRPSDPYEIPQGFSVTDYLFLPFDFSDGTQVEVTFSFPAGTGDDEISSISHGRGDVERTAERVLWRIGARDVAGAAAFALGHASRGMRPFAPAALVEAWNALIEKAVDHGSKT